MSEEGVRVRPASMDKCRVCFPFAGGLIGGSHISAMKLIQGLHHTQFEPVVLLHSLDGPLPDFLTSAGIAFERAPIHHYWQAGGVSLRDLPQMPADIARIRAFLRARNIRIVHTNEGAMHATWGMSARLAGARHIWHHRGNPRAAGLRFLAPIVADRVICVSNFASPLQGLWSARGKSTVAYSPFDTSIAHVDRKAARSTIEERLGVAPDTVIISFLGHFSTRKRPLVFVETIAAMRRARPDRRIVGLMFGDEHEAGIDAKIRQKIQDLDVADCVRMMGFLQPVEPWLAASDVLLVPAVEEPFGRTLIEAMLIGTPVVAAASGGNIEAIRNRGTGLLARPDDPEDLAAHVLGVIEDPRMATTIAHRARQEALQKFSVETHVNKIARIYREALAI
ncbi:glycosyltransferase family 4 protein [Sphingobium sp.]|uniref:glycosyltransferase family 4 protein n=1 Tax=Sphingobium sp. TaxID=1912891 RepID=UPI002B860358|nr:glycosyltransferase family 4 protein [Sphingobium sp.]HUD91509.1 glycosyltransferase family 4 protein [Sphingobium sp.]